MTPNKKDTDYNPSDFDFQGGEQIKKLFMGYIRELVYFFSYPLPKGDEFWYKIRLLGLGPEISRTQTRQVMSRVCQITGKRPQTGNNVSHANNKTRRRFLPNLHAHRFWVESENRWIKLRISSKGMRIIDKLGIDQVLADIRKRGEKI